LGIISISNGSASSAHPPDGGSGGQMLAAAAAAAADLARVGLCETGSPVRFGPTGSGHNFLPGSTAQRASVASRCAGITLFSPEIQLSTLLVPTRLTVACLHPQNGKIGRKSLASREAKPLSLCPPPVYLFPAKLAPDANLASRKRQTLARPFDRTCYRR